MMTSLFVVDLKTAVARYLGRLAAGLRAAFCCNNPFQTDPTEFLDSDFPDIL